MLQINMVQVVKIQWWLPLFHNIEILININIS
jgi:hypothetical protein